MPILSVSCRNNPVAGIMPEIVGSQGLTIIKTRELAGLSEVAL